MKNVHYMTRLELETELIERRLQVSNLIKEIQRKDEYIRIYSEGLNKIMEENNKQKTLKKNSLERWSKLIMIIVLIIIAFFLFLISISLNQIVDILDDIRDRYKGLR